jgi:hypothetical protein
VSSRQAVPTEELMGDELSPEDRYMTSSAILTLMPTAGGDEE